MSTVDYLPFSFQFIKATGLVPSSTLQTKLFTILFSLPVVVALNFMVFYQLKSANEGDILLLAEAFESLSTLGQLSVRLFLFVVHGKLIESIIRDCKSQWRYDLFGQKLGAQMEKKMNFCIKLTKALAICSIGTITLMCATALTTEEKPVPLMCWFPDVKWGREITFLSQILILLVTLHFVVATDSFYLLVGMDLQIQFKLMGEIIKSINFEVDDENKCITKLVKCVRHHQLQLKLYKNLNRVFSEYFIVQYTITVTAVAMQIYLILYSNASFDTVLKGVVYVFTVMLQVALYFIPASNIEIQAENFSSEIYFSNWENITNLKISKLFHIILMKSQETLNMLGAGMLHINRPEYLVILRLGFSIATILGGLK